MTKRRNIAAVTGWAVVCDECDAWIDEPMPLHLEAQVVCRDHTRDDGVVRCNRCEWKRLNPDAVATGRAAAAKLNAGGK